MANLFENLGDWFARRVASYVQDSYSTGYNILSNYYSGDHRPQLKTKVGQPSDNITQNYVGLAVDRSVSRLLRGGVEFILSDGEDAQKEYFDYLWDLNKEKILLYQVALHGAVYGTCYLKINPGGITDPYTGNLYPRLIAIDPETIRIKTNPQDLNEVEQYRIEYKVKREYQGGEREFAYREITRKTKEQDYEDTAEMSTTWIIEHYEQSPVYSNQWTLVDTIEWPYPFPPIIHWKNLPSLKSCYGDSDIDDIINIQDKSNFVVSNMSKIIKNFAHPETFVFGIGVKALADGKLDGAVGNLYAINDKEAKVQNLEMNSDLASSRSLGLDLRQSIFDISREVDISSMTDKLGALTNFGLHVLYTDALDKNDTKRQLYGDALLELNRRLLVLAGWQGLDTDPGEIRWGDALPVNIAEEITTDKTALELGIVDKETIAKRYKSRYGVDWKTIQANIKKGKETENANSANIGANILRNFNQGKGLPIANQMMDANVNTNTTR